MKRIIMCLLLNRHDDFINGFRTERGDALHCYWCRRCGRLL